MKILALCFILAAVEQGYGQDVSFNDLDQQDTLHEILSGHFKDQKASSTCANSTCSSCHRVFVPRIGVNANVCFMGSYLPEASGISWNVTVDERNYTLGNVSTENPQMVCGGIVGLRHIAKLCILFTNVKIQNHTFSGCVFVRVSGRGRSVYKTVSFGCIKLPSDISEQMSSFIYQSDVKPKNSYLLKPMIASDQEQTMTAEKEIIVLTRMRIMAKKSST